jgi:hydroxymethylbilane synthase
MEKDRIVIGTRGSELALAQAHEVQDRLQASHGPDLLVEVEVISTKGDRVTDRPLSEIGGKGLFTEEIEERLSAGKIDIAVHSSKDMPTELPEGLALTCFLSREDPGDAFISGSGSKFEDLPHGAVVGSSSLRRRALLLRMRPDLKVVEFRGNVQTRLRKLEEKVAEATLLAVSGLNRLHMKHIITETFDMDVFPPAPGQGAICIESREGDQPVLDLLAPLNDAETENALTGERSFLAGLDGSCRTPIGGHARIDGNHLRFHGMILKPDGTESHEQRLEGSVADASSIGAECARILRDRAGSRFFEDWDITP